MSNLNIDLSKAAVPEVAFNHNRKVLQSFDKRTTENLLGIINVSGNELSRVNNVAWPTQWVIRQDLNPIVTTLAGTFNPLLDVCKEKMSDYHNNPDSNNFFIAIESVSLAKEMLSEIELIKDSYVYRYGDVAGGKIQNLEQTIHNALPWSYQRNPHKIYASQNTALSTLNQFCKEQRRVVDNITTEMKTYIILFLQNNFKEEMNERIFKSDPSLLKDKEFVNIILNSRHITASVKTEIKKLITDPEVIASLTFLTPSAGFTLSDEVIAKANARNQGLLRTRTGTTLTMEDAEKITNITLEHDVDEKHGH